MFFLVLWKQYCWFIFVFWSGCCSVCLYSLLYYLIWWSHTSATPRNYHILKLLWSSYVSWVPSTDLQVSWSLSQWHYLVMALVTNWCEVWDAVNNHSHHQRKYHAGVLHPYSFFDYHWKTRGKNHKPFHSKKANIVYLSLYMPTLMHCAGVSLLCTKGLFICS